MPNSFKHNRVTFNFDPDAVVAESYFVIALVPLHPLNLSAFFQCIELRNLLESKCLNGESDGRGNICKLPEKPFLVIDFHSLFFRPE